MIPIRRRLLWRVFFSHFALIALGAIAVALLGWSTFKGFYIENQVARLENLVSTVQPYASTVLAEEDQETAQLYVSQMTASQDWRVSLIRPDGMALADSDPDAAEQPHRFLDRPEIEAALRGRAVSGHRLSNRYDEEIIFVAYPATQDGRIVGVVHASRRYSSLTGDLVAARNRLMLGTGAVLLIVGAAALTMSERFIRPLEEMRRGAKRFGGGELTRKLPVPHSYELKSLAETLNTMAEQLHNRIREITAEGNLRDAILESLQEGVLAVDAHERLLGMNGAAAAMLRSNQAWAKGRLIQEAVRSTDLQRLIKRALATHPSADAVPLHGGGAQGGIGHQIRIGEETLVQVSWAPLRDTAGSVVGVVVILANVTRLMRLENIRREFVGNVSHELRTPIASVRGYAETLLDGALDDPEDARRFTERILNQSERLGEIIEDLLCLSGLESQSQIELAERPLDDIVESAVQSCQFMAQERSALLETRYEAPVMVKLNGRLLERAFSNLIENGLKYGGKRVEVRTTVAEDRGTFWAEVHVRDFGPGIAREHLPRIFERFYRVDKARSRDQGGTGLGLSIVKHVVNAHGGTVWVESQLGHGANFVCRLPATGQSRPASAVLDAPECLVNDLDTAGLPGPS
ncbi:MAG: ATP-binding protein [Sumerlaeia bacterium]